MQSKGMTQIRIISLRINGVIMTDGAVHVYAGQDRRRHRYLRMTVWAELASQRHQLTEGLAEQGKVLTEVLAKQSQLMASPTAMLPPFG